MCRTLLNIRFKRRYTLHNRYGASLIYYRRLPRLVIVKSISVHDILYLYKMQNIAFGRLLASFSCNYKWKLYKAIITKKCVPHCPMRLTVNPIQDGLFRSCSRMVWAFCPPPPSLKSATKIIQWWNLAQLYLI